MATKNDPENGGVNVYKIVERKNRLAVHGMFDSRERADNWLQNVLPVYISRGYFDDKTLGVDDFEIVYENLVSQYVKDHQPPEIRR